MTRASPTGRSPWGWLAKCNGERTSEGRCALLEASRVAVTLVTLCFMGVHRGQNYSLHDRDADRLIV